MTDNRRRALIIALTGKNDSGGLTDADGKYVSDSSDALIECADGAYRSAFTAAQMDSFITSVSGGAA